MIIHHDAAPYNVVWRPHPGAEDLTAEDLTAEDATAEDATAQDADAGELVGVIDWDLAHPAAPLEDLAFVALTWVPLTAHDVACRDGFPAGVDRARRLRMLLDAYGWTGTVADVLHAVRVRAAAHSDGLRRAAWNG